MNKQELIDNMAESADISKAAASRALDAMIDSISGALKKGDSLTLVGFGTFSVRSRAARAGRNPKTGETIQIKASKVPAFKAGKAREMRKALGAFAFLGLAELTEEGKDHTHMNESRSKPARTVFALHFPWTANLAFMAIE
ncbi:MAG: HU family DNA-binding protein [Gammaproteobacteria bacterium]|nr:HU family DNA-binding protein [Gammaproteobacteria bacterium]